MRFLKGVSVAAALGLTLVGSAAAQSANGSITATAKVRQPITITGAQNLDFGIVLQGTAKTISETSAAAGQFAATGTPNSNINVDFTLPANLTNGANNLAIGSWTGCYNQSAAVNTSGCTNIANLAGTTATSFGNVSGTGSLWVFVGATVSPTAAQAVGTYNGTVTMTLTYF
jgi:hypothetical protein